MSKFTPGPWRIDKDNQNVYANGLLAQTYGHVHTGEKLANAQLIAAAPVMYEALEKLLSHCSHLPDIPLNTLAKANGALTKARGES